MRPLILCMVATVVCATVVAATTEATTHNGRAPGGFSVKCAHEVPSGSVVQHDRVNGGFHVTTLEGRVYTIPSCHKTHAERRTAYAQKRATVLSRKALNVAPPSPSFVPMSSTVASFQGGWQVYAKDEIGNNFSKFLGEFSVPNDPKTYNGQTVFLFTGLQNIDWVPPDDGPNSTFDIIQPVLQYGPAANGGGNYWEIASWYVPLGGWFDESTFSSAVIVHPDDVIFGNMTRTGVNSWFIDSIQTSTATHTNITVSDARLASQPFAYVTLESYADYDSLTCDEWPSGSSLFKKLEVDISRPLNWTMITKDNICNAAVKLSGKSDIEIDF